jgi:enoyl-CoA hydratase/carnithine racemase
VSAVDLLRDQFVRDVVVRARDMAKQIVRWRTQLLADIEAFVDLSAEQYGVEHGGAKGNVTLISYDGLFKIQRNRADKIVFDERLQAAKALIDECVSEWSSDARVEIKALVQHAFQADGTGKVSTERVLGLRRLEITHPKWREAMRAINDSIQVTGSSTYVRCYEFIDGSWHALPLGVNDVRHHPNLKPSEDHHE